MRKIVALYNEINFKKYASIIKSSDKPDSFNEILFNEIHKSFNTWADQNLEATPQQEIKHLSNLLSEKLKCEVRILKVSEENNETYLQNFFAPIYPENTATNNRIKEIKKKWKTVIKKPEIYKDIDNSFLLPKDTVFQNKEKIDSKFSHIKNIFQNNKLAYFEATPGFVQRIYNKKILNTYGEKNTKSLLYFPIYNKEKVIAIAEISQWLNEEPCEYSILKNSITLKELISKGPNCLSDRIGEGNFFDAKHCLDPNSSNVTNYPYYNYNIEEINCPAFRCPNLEQLMTRLMSNILNEVFPGLTPNQIKAYFNCAKLIIIRNAENKPVGFIVFDYLKDLEAKPVYISGAFFLPEAQSKGLLSFLSLNFFKEEIKLRGTSWVNFFKPCFFYLYRTHNPRVFEILTRGCPTYPNINVLRKEFNKVVKNEITKSCKIILNDRKISNEEKKKKLEFLKILFEDKFVLLTNKKEKKSLFEEKEYLDILKDDVEKKPEKFIRYILKKQKYLTYNLKTIRQFENSEYNENQKRDNVLIRDLGDKIKKTMKDNIKEKYRKLAEEKLRPSLGDDINNLDVYDRILFVQKNIAPKLDKYETRDLANKSYINDFVHGIVKYDDTKQKQDTMMGVSKISPFTIFKNDIFLRIKNILATH